MRQRTLQSTPSSRLGQRPAMQHPKGNLKVNGGSESGVGNPELGFLGAEINLDPLSTRYFEILSARAGLQTYSLKGFDCIEFSFLKVIRMKSVEASPSTIT